uniref:Transmembrane protein n=1 Tax=Schistosoma mansoni TaxID=6183 RepID=A0A5K4FD78_SCHMA
MNQLIKIKRLFRTYKFLHIFLKINILSILIYFLLIIINNYRFPNINYHASIVRDREELRLAHLRTLMYDWYDQGKIPFVYQAPQSLNNKHGIVISIMTSNRVQYQIDNYQPNYLTQSLSTLIKLIFDDITKYGYRFKYIYIMICLNGTNINELSNIYEIIQLIDQYSIYPLHNNQLTTYINLSIPCQFINDMSNCMLKSIDLIKKQQEQYDNDYILIIKEDMIAINNLFDILWRLIMQQSMHHYDHKLGMIQLYSYKNVIRFPFYHPMDRQLFQFIFTCLLFITFIIFFIYLCVPFNKQSSSRYGLYKFYLIINFFITLFIIIWLYGLNNLWIQLFNLFLISHHYNDVVIQLNNKLYYPKMDMIMANLYPIEQVKQISYYLKQSIELCENKSLWNLKPNESKYTQLITSYFISNAKQIFTVYMNLFKHCGLYSNEEEEEEEKRILNPADVEY